ncbi:hypothetical protein SAMN05216328_1556 [Ensifer sp. YR511]|nr:hypothetical protein SAMN05216328_1556 [Ensifer sp. YR511]
MQFVELSPTVRPATSQGDAVVASVFTDKPAVSTIPVNLQDPAITAQMSCDALGRTTVFKAIGYQRRTATSESAVIALMEIST